MRKHLICAASAAALLISGAAIAQSGGSGSGSGSTGSTGSSGSSGMLDRSPSTTSQSQGTGSSGSLSGTDTSRSGTAGSTSGTAGSTDTMTSTTSERTTSTTSPSTGSATTGTGATTMGSSASDPSKATTATTTTSSATKSAGMDRASAEKLMGQPVYGANDQEIGEVADIILDESSGQARQLIVGTGGFLGMGEKKVAVPFEQAEIGPQQDRVTISSLDKQSVEAMQEFEYEDTTVSLTRDKSEAGGSTTTTKTQKERSGTSGQ